MLSYSRVFVLLLLESGANPKIRDHDGFSPSDVAPFSLQSIIGRYLKRALREERERLRTEAGGRLRVCSLSDCQQRDKVMRCSGCYLAFYCGRTCQRKDWDSHREVCKVHVRLQGTGSLYLTCLQATQAEYKTLYLEDTSVTGTCFLTRKVSYNKRLTIPWKQEYRVNIYSCIQPEIYLK